MDWGKKLPTRETRRAGTGRSIVCETGRSRWTRLSRTLLPVSTSTRRRFTREYDNVPFGSFFQISPTSVLDINSPPTPPRARSSGGRRLAFERRSDRTRTVCRSDTRSALGGERCGAESEANDHPREVPVSLASKERDRSKPVAREPGRRMDRRRRLGLSEVLE